ncbi:carbohydrate-binding module family 20 domain-containing protein [Pseudomonas frederiksbergensis]|uniref:carbohydrate-binding module family 20 domain-containing protein n=1 Tax=Pseudomonas frederiksbergensis TaxID=104087 RepID=UPI003D210DB1
MLPVFRDVQGGQWIPLRSEVNFQCDNGVTTRDYSVYVVGNRPELGDWDPTKA